MTRTIYRNNRIAIVLGLIILLFAVGMQRAFAAEGTVMPDVDGETKTPISGMELTIYKVADLTVKNGDARYKLTEDFSEAEIDFNGMTAADSLRAAITLRDIAVAKALEGTKAVSEAGYATFGSVPNGMYLVVQTGATGQAAEYSAIEPFLLMAPQPTVATVDNNESSWNYDVVSVPKVVLGTYQPPPPPDEEDVKPEYEDSRKGKRTNTGDYNLTVVWSLIAVIAACLIVFFVIKRRRNNE